MESHSKKLLLIHGSNKIRFAIYMKVWLEKTGYVAGVVFNGDNIYRGKDLLAEKLCSPETAKKVARYLVYLENKYGDVWDVVVGSLG